MKGNPFKTTERDIITNAKQTSHRQKKNNDFKRYKKNQKKKIVFAPRNVIRKQYRKYLVNKIEIFIKSFNIK